MRVVLVGADIEENLGIGMVAATARGRGHDLAVVPFDEPGSLPRVASRILAEEPDVVGLGIQFQHRAGEFLGLAARLRRLGFRGHLCCGGQLPTMAWREVLEGGHGVDSVVLHEGEQTLPDLLDALEADEPLAGVPGLAILADDGAPVRTEGRPLVADLDELPFPERYRSHSRHFGVPFVPILGGRGCWGSCAFCSITTFLRDARAHGGGRMLRRRSPEDVAAEMASLCRAAGGSAIFCFHDDNLLDRRPERSLERIRRIREAFDALGGGRAALVGKCRPDAVTAELATELAALGTIRMYVGVENASAAGSRHLRRRAEPETAEAALRACHDAGIFVCYNLLVFEPDTTLEDLGDNLAFIRRNARHPVNFCRAEPYYGTPLHRELERRGTLRGSYLGFGYRIEDDLAELAFRVSAAAFRQRNFDPAGVANRYMGLGYSAKILEFFFDDPEGRVARATRRAEELTRAISLETAGFLERAIDVALRHGRKDPDRLARETALLGLRIAEADARRHAELDEALADMNRLVGSAARRRQACMPAWVRTASRVALGAALAVGAASCDGCASGRDQVVDPPPPPADARPGPVILPPDPLPPPDPVPHPPDVVDPVPAAADAGPGPVVLPPDPPPPPPDVVDPLPPPDPAPPPPDPVPRPSKRVDPGPPADRVPPPDPVPRPRPGTPTGGPKGADAASAPKAAFRSTTATLAPRDELPLADPPSLGLVARRRDDLIVVELRGADEPASLRWETAGTVDGDGPRARWRPRSPDDQLRVAVRTHGGVAVAAIRAREVRSEGS